MLLFSFFFKRGIRTPGTPWFSTVWFQKFGGASHYESLGKRISVGNMH